MFRVVGAVSLRWLRGLPCRPCCAYKCKCLSFCLWGLHRPQMAQYKSAHRLDGSLFIGRMVTACSPIAEGGATKCTLALINQPSDYFRGCLPFG